MRHERTFRLLESLEATRKPAWPSRRCPHCSPKSGELRPMELKFDCSWLSLGLELPRFFKCTWPDPARQGRTHSGSAAIPQKLRCCVAPRLCKTDLRAAARAHLSSMAACDLIDTLLMEHATDVLAECLGRWYTSTMDFLLAASQPLTT